MVIKDENIITEITPIKISERLCVKVVPIEKHYKTNWARISPFLLAKGRDMISVLMEPHINEIKRVHTDGFICLKKIDSKGSGLGDLRFEGICNYCEIKNNIEILGEFKY